MDWVMMTFLFVCMWFLGYQIGGYRYYEKGVYDSERINKKHIKEISDIYEIRIEKLKRGF